MVDIPRYEGGTAIICPSCAIENEASVHNEMEFYEKVDHKYTMQAVWTCFFCRFRWMYSKDREAREGQQLCQQ